MKKYIETHITPTQSKGRNHIYIPTSELRYFPDIYEKFQIIDSKNKKEYTVHLEKQNRIPGLKGFFKSNPEIKKDTKIYIEILKKKI